MRQADAKGAVAEAARGMVMAAEDGFFSRWSRRKAESRPPAAPVESAVAESAPPPVAQAEAAPALLEPLEPPPTLATATPTPDLPTLADVAALTPEADFSRFVARGVSTQVRNAAMKKLFADPRFNVMDGLDIYIDDYSIPSPIEPEVVAEMLSSPFFDHTRLSNPPAPTAEAPAMPAADLSGETALAEPSPPPEPTTTPHDHADLLLQPDPAAGPPGPGPGAG